MQFVYSVWFRDPSFPEDDQDYEWPASYIIDGATAESTKAWGDRLAERYAAGHQLVFISSVVENVDDATLPELTTLPVIVEGEDPTDDKIGW